MSDTKITTEGRVAFRDVPGFPGYRVGDDGSVWTCWRKSWHRSVIGGEWRELRQARNGQGYLGVRLSRGGRMHSRKTHRLVLEAFVGPRPDGHEACHWNGVRTDNRLANLRWDTGEANLSDRDRHGHTAVGERNHTAKLTEADVRAIRASTESTVALAERFGIQEAQAWKVRTGRAWRHIPIGTQSGDAAGTP